MFDRRRVVLTALAAALAPVRRASAALDDRPGAARLRPDAIATDAGNRARTGLWDVTETMWATPDAQPVVSTGLVAERRMVGDLLQEIIRSTGHDPDAKRIDYLKYDRIEGRWDYVSVETRVAVGIMPAWSFGPEQDGRIELVFQPFATDRGADGATGRMLRMRQIIDRRQPDRDSKDQFFAFADGSGRSWLAHRYAYVRRV